VVELDSYFLVGNFFVTLVNSAYSNCYAMKDLGYFATLHCMCWSMDYSLEGNYSGPHSLLAPDLQIKTWDKSQWCGQNGNKFYIP
jgi:hypothetical protein